MLALMQIFGFVLDLAEYIISMEGPLQFSSFVFPFSIESSFVESRYLYLKTRK